MEYKYKIISPYFGKLPSNFDAFLISCKNNKKFKFYILTDDERKFFLPENVEIIKMTFDEMKEKIQSKFDFKIGLDVPYKLCDYKPVYGYIFDDLLSDCEYWGYCDLDMIFGDLEKYMPSKKYDKISHLGPFCMYRNTKKIRESFMLNGFCKFNYKNVLGSKVHFGFDEIGKYGINSIFIKNNLSIYEYQKNAADINCILEGMNVTSGHSGHYKTDEGKRVFQYKDGKIYGYLVNGDSIEKKEYAYIHFQKRKMNCKISVSDKINDFMILHHSIEETPKKEIDIDYINANQPTKKMDYKKWFNLKKRAVIMRIKRYSVIIKNK